VGDDDNGQRVRRLLDASGIQTHLGSDPQLQTTVKLRIIGRQQQLLRADFESEPRSEVLASQTRQFHTLLPQHQAVLFSDYGKGGLTHIADMITAARAANLPVLIDPKGSDYSRYAGATVITPNRAELQQVVGRWHDEAHLLQLAQALRKDLKLDALLLTRSEEGMSLFDAQGVLHVPAVAREVFDVTGAGDTVIATLASLMGAGMSMREALPWANKAGGIVVGKFGTASVTFQELSA
jgi:rfaE bifunctional protein kinase chain/domain